MRDKFQAERVSAFCDYASETIEAIESLSFDVTTVAAKPDALITYKRRYRVINFCHICIASRVDKLLANYLRDVGRSNVVVLII